MNPTIRSQITAEYNRVDALARDLFPQYRNMPKPTLTFFIKGKAAGWARLSKWEVSINEYLASQNMDMIFNTISHEVAHVVAYNVYGDRGHGMNWKRVHRALGGTASRCYNAAENGVKPMAGRRSNWYLYRCPVSNTETWVGPKYHNGLQRGKYTGLRNMAQGISIKSDHYTGKSELRG